MSTLFPLPPESANTNEALRALADKYPEINATYLNLHMRPDWIKAKEFFDSAWNSYETFADKDFSSQIQISFSQRAWELYLFHLLKERSLNILTQSKRRPNPDFKIGLGDRSLFVEAVVAGKGQGSNAVETTSDRLSRVPPGTIVSHGGSFDELNHPKLRRITSALKEKLGNYLTKHKNTVGGRDYYVIAINAGDIEGNMTSSPEALILEAVKGINPAIHLPLQSDGTLGPAYHTTRSSILNSQGTSPIELDLFSKDEFKEISGVIFFGRDIINAVLQQVKGEEVIFVHNPNVSPEKKMNLDIFSHFTQITISPTDWTRHPAVYL